MYHCTRRELVASLLGLPAVAMSGCSSHSRQSDLPPGELVGASARIGHQVRDGFDPTPAADQWTRTSVAIIGGGVAGYSAAWRLLKAGWRDVVLLELEPVPGGTSCSGQSATGPYPWGAHYLHVPMKENRGLLELLDEASVLEGRDVFDEPIVAEQFLCRKPTERLFLDGRWQAGLVPRRGMTATDRAHHQSFQQHIDRWVAWRDGQGRRAFALPLAHSSDDPVVTELDQITMAEWLRQHDLTSPRLRWYIDYCCRDDYGTTVEQTSAWAALFYFAARIRKAADEAQQLITWPAGNGWLVSHLHQRVAREAAVRLGLAVTRIAPTESGPIDVVAVEHDAATAHGFRADYVVFAAPQFLRPYLIRNREVPASLGEFEYGSWMVANLHLRDRPTANDIPLCWDNVLYDSPSLGYVVATHQRQRHHGPTTFTYYFPLCDDDPATARSRLLEIDRDGWAEVALSDLERAHPNLRRLVTRLDVMRWGHAMIRPRPGFLFGGARREAALPESQIFFANTDLSGVALFEEAFYHGTRAAEEVLATAGRAFTSLL